MQTSSTLHHKYGHLHSEHFSSQVLGFSSDQNSMSQTLAWGLALPDWNEILFLFAQNSIQIILLFLWNLSHFFYIYKKIFKNVCTNSKEGSGSLCLWAQLIKSFGWEWSRFCQILSQLNYKQSHHEEQWQCCVWEQNGTGPMPASPSKKLIATWGEKL